MKRPCVILLCAAVPLLLPLSGSAAREDEATAPKREAPAGEPTATGADKQETPEAAPQETPDVLPTEQDTPEMDREPAPEPAPAEEPGDGPLQAPDKEETPAGPATEPTSGSEPGLQSDPTPEPDDKGHAAAEETASSENPNIGAKQIYLPVSRKKRPKMFTFGLGAPLGGFAYKGIIEGKGWANTSSHFLWGNLDIRFLVRLTKRFSVGGGLLQSFIYFDGIGAMGGHLVADFRFYAVPDYLYFKMDLFFGFPMLFAMGPAMGHSFSVTKRVSIFIENQFLFMAVAGLYGFWQPTIGVATRF